MNYLNFIYSDAISLQNIQQAKDLAAKDTNGLSDPYVRVTLLPDKKRRLETKIKRRTLSPRWNETFYFEGKYFFGLAFFIVLRTVVSNPSGIFFFIWPKLTYYHTLTFFSKVSPSASYSQEFCIFMSLTMIDSQGMIQLEKFICPFARY